MVNPWRPVVEGRAAEVYRSCVAEIEAVLADPPATWRRAGADQHALEVSVGLGAAGFALFHAGLRHSDRLGQHCNRCLRRSIDAISRHRLDASFYGGFTGIAWALELLRKRAAAYSPNPDDVDDIDRALAKYVGTHGDFAELDLINGLVGIGVYALERAPRHAALDLLDKLVQVFARRSLHVQSGTTWLSRSAPPSGHDAQAPDAGRFVLGMAHGVPGIVSVLCGAFRLGVQPNRARSLIDGALRWTLAQEHPHSFVSRFPAWVEAGATSSGTSRLSWCYGDLGVALSLIHAGQVLDDDRYVAKARTIALAAASRDVSTSGIVDAGLCHGAAGVAHLFARLHQYLGDTQLAHAARFWLERTLALREPGTGLVGWSATYYEGAHPMPRSEPGLYMGLAGIGLAFSAAISEREPDWDRALLASLPLPRATSHT